LYSLPSIIRMIQRRRMRWEEHVAWMENRHACRLSVGKPEGRRPLGRPRCRCVGSVKLDLRDIVWGGIDWIDLAQDRDRWRALVNTMLHLRVSENVRMLMSSWTTGGLTRGILLHSVSYLSIKYVRPDT
jgi:hypothetical protein